MPTLIAKLPQYYIDFSRDPLIGGAFGTYGDPAHYVWFKSFLLLEACVLPSYNFSVHSLSTSFFQLPMFFFGLRGLIRATTRIYIPLLIYAASTTTTTLPCLAVVLATPAATPELIAAGLPAVTDIQRIMLLASYVPFFLIPLVMTVDMAYRVWHEVKRAARMREAFKMKPRKFD